MNRPWRWFLPIIAAVILIASTIALSGRRPDANATVLLQPAVAPDLEGFAKVQRPVQVELPEDFGPHPEFLTEWWYYTGNLTTEGGRHFGYQLTFFRRALAAPDSIASRPSGWASNQLYMAHFALTDTQNSDFFAFERFSRASAGLAGAQAEPFQVWLEDWQVVEREDGNHSVRASADSIEIHLTLDDIKGPILQGENGYSPKGSEPGNASVYISQTRLSTKGEVRVNGETLAVRGSSWMDHEYSTSALGPGLIGWDWFSLQLDDGSELMLFTLRREDGTQDPFSSGTVIAVSAATRLLGVKDFTIQATDIWRSPHSNAVYPSGWTIRIPSEQLELQVKPVIKDQELNLSFTYWEGAVQVSGSRNGQPMSGQGYVELTGYAASMQGQF